MRKTEVQKQYCYGNLNLSLEERFMQYHNPAQDRGCQNDPPAKVLIKTFLTDIVAVKFLPFDFN